MTRFAGRVAVVSGGATSIGAAIVEAFYAEGAAVIILDIAKEEGAALAAQLGSRALFIETDVRDEAALERAIAALQALGGIDCLIHAACSYVDQGLDSSREVWLDGLGVTVVGGARLLALARPHLAKRGGAVVFLGSVAGRFGQRGRAVYPVAKAALQQLVRSAAVDLAPDGIRVNAVTPGWTWSGPVERATGGDRAKADRIGADYHPLGRIADAEEVAAAVLFLCSDVAGFSTGADLTVDGGYSVTGPDGGIPATGRLAMPEAEPEHELELEHELGAEHAPELEHAAEHAPAHPFEAEHEHAFEPESGSSFPALDDWSLGPEK